MVRTRYSNGDRVIDIADETGIHELTIYRWCEDLVKAQARKSTGRRPTINKDTVVRGLKNNLTQQAIADQCGTTRQAICMFIKRHNLRDTVAIDA